MNSPHTCTRMHLYRRTVLRNVFAYRAAALLRLRFMPLPGTSTRGGCTCDYRSVAARTRCSWVKDGLRTHRKLPSLGSTTPCRICYLSAFVTALLLATLCHHNVTLSPTSLWYASVSLAARRAQAPTFIFDALYGTDRTTRCCCRHLNARRAATKHCTPSRAPPCAPRTTKRPRARATTCSTPRCCMAVRSSQEQSLLFVLCYTFAAVERRR